MQIQVDFSEFEALLVYVMCSKTARSLHGDTLGGCGVVCLGSHLVTYTCSPSGWEVEARSEVQGHPDLCNKLETPA